MRGRDAQVLNHGKGGTEGESAFLSDMLLWGSASCYFLSLELEIVLLVHNS